MAHSTQIPNHPQASEFVVRIKPSDLRERIRPPSGQSFPVNSHRLLANHTVTKNGLISKKLLSLSLPPYR